MPALHYACPSQKAQANLAVSHGAPGGLGSSMQNQDGLIYLLQPQAGKDPSVCHFCTLGLLFVPVLRVLVLISVHQRLLSHQIDVLIVVITIWTLGASS